MICKGNLDEDNSGKQGRLFGSGDQGRLQDFGNGGGGGGVGGGGGGHCIRVHQRDVFPPSLWSFASPLLTPKTVPETLY